MANIIPFTGNSHKAPAEQRLTVHEAPLVRQYEQRVDAGLMNMYRQVVQIPLGRVAGKATETPLGTSNQAHQFTSPAAMKQFENKLAETAQFGNSTGVPALDDSENAVALRQALANVNAALDRSDHA